MSGLWLDRLSEGAIIHLAFTLLSCCGGFGSARVGVSSIQQRERMAAAVFGRRANSGAMRSRGWQVLRVGSGEEEEWRRHSDKCMALIGIGLWSESAKLKWVWCQPFRLRMLKVTATV